ncbi:type I restriction enzyme HsdR N-terminal domain-containing protein [Desulfobacula sp.]
MENQPNPHHLVLGKLNDFLTGSVLADTLDERFRQKIAKILVMEGKFEKIDIENNITVEVIVGLKKATLKIDFLVNFQEKTIALIKFAPGSLVTRRLSTLALSRMIKPYQIPIVVLTNGKDAEILEGDSGKVIATGLQNLPDKERIEKNMTSFSFKPINKALFDKASRIAYAFEIDGACPCDSGICKIE